MFQSCCTKCEDYFEMNKNVINHIIKKFSMVSVLIVSYNSLFYNKAWHYKTDTVIQLIEFSQEILLNVIFSRKGGCQCWYWSICAVLYNLVFKLLVAYIGNICDASQLSRGQLNLNVTWGLSSYFRSALRLKKKPFLRAWSLVLFESCLLNWR